MKKFLSVFAFLAFCSLANAEVFPSPKIDWSNDLVRKYQKDDKVKQILLVQYTGQKNIGEQSANVILFEKVKVGKKRAWREILRTTAFVGKNGIDKEREGDNKTPSGEYSITQAFGIMPKPKTKLPYIDIDENVWACDESGKYNTIVRDGSCTSGEHMIDYSPEYNYGFAIDYNQINQPSKGSAIFFHLKGAKPFTAGCVAFDEKDMLFLLKTLDKNAKIMIDYSL